jgi:RNA polymerase sigma factor (sigma-70 family)
MPSAPLISLLRHLRHVVAPKFEQCGDDTLLHAFVTRHDEESFAALVRRHGALVLNTCRHVLGHEQDAEDAFQATFLVLARKAASIRDAASLAGFLHGVAYRLSWKAKRDAARRRKREAQAPPRTQSQGTDELAWREVQALVEEEIDRLPRKYRTPFIRCYLQGLSRAEAARELGVKEGTIWSRLSWARRRLQERLARRGVALSAVLAAFALSDRAATAALTRLREIASANARAFAAGQTLTETVSARAVALAQTGLSTVAAGKLKRAMTGLLLLILTGVGGAFFSARTPNPQAVPPNAKPAEAPRREPAAKAPVDRHGDPLPDAAIARLGTVRWRHGFGVSALAYSPDGKTIAAAGAGRALTLWDAATGKEVRQFPNINQPIGLAFSPDGKTLASGVGWENIRLWDVATGRERFPSEEHHAFINHVRFTPNGAGLISLSRDRRILWWDLATQTSRRQFTWTGQGGIHAALSPDGKVIAAGDRSREGCFVRLWDTATGKELCRHTGHREEVGALAFSPDGKLIASGAGWFGQKDNSGHVWEAATGRLIRRFEGHHSCVGGVTFAPDGLSVASGAGDSTILLGDITGRRPDGRWHKKPLSSRQLEACWTARADEDTAKAYDAVWKLVAAPEQAVPFLQKHLPPVPRPDAQAVARLIADLDSDEFPVRQKATKELAKLGDAIAPDLRGALAKKPALEMRRRVQQLLDQTRDWTPKRLRDHRAIQALEHVGSPPAREVLQALAEGAPEARRTEESKAALQRMARSSVPAKNP